MAAVETCLARVLDGQGRVVGVVGEPGVGKTRLCNEVAERARLRGIQVYATRCLPHGEMISFFPLRRLLRQLLQVQEDETDESARQRVSTILARTRPLSEQAPLLLDFLGIARDGGAATATKAVG
jgi:adenylate cyclase